MELKEIAHIRSDFPEKFGIPRQSGIVEELRAEIVFLPEYRSPDAVRGLDSFTHLWLLWGFSQSERSGWSPTVRPPRLGGNTRMGVFATRSPFRPNPIGLSCVRLIEVELSPARGPVLHIAGADMLDKTPIYDIKPYLPYVDSYPDAANGFALDTREGTLRVEFLSGMTELIPQDKLPALTAVLAQDPRPQYQDDPERMYYLKFGGQEIGFTVKEKTLTVCSVSAL